METSVLAVRGDKGRGGPSVSDLLAQVGRCPGSRGSSLPYPADPTLKQEHRNPVYQDEWGRERRREELLAPTQGGWGDEGKRTPGKSGDDCWCMGWAGAFKGQVPSSPVRLTGVRLCVYLQVTGTSLAFQEHRR